MRAVEWACLLICPVEHPQEFKMKTFKEWLKANKLTISEVGTGTNCVAVFSRPLGAGEEVVRKNKKDLEAKQKTK